MFLNLQKSCLGYQIRDRIYGRIDFSIVSGRTFTQAITPCFTTSGEDKKRCTRSIEDEDVKCPRADNRPQARKQDKCKDIMILYRCIHWRKRRARANVRLRPERQKMLTGEGGERPNNEEGPGALYRNGPEDLFKPFLPFSMAPCPQPQRSRTGWPERGLTYPALACERCSDCRRL